MTPPWPGLGAYAASKAALGTMVEAYRAEHPTVGFTRVIVGDCAGGEGASMTEFASGWDMEVFMDLHPLWESGNLLSGLPHGCRGTGPGGRHRAAVRRHGHHPDGGRHPAPTGLSHDQRPGGADPQGGRRASIRG